MYISQWIGEIVGDVLVEFFVLFLGNLTFGACPEGRSLIDDFVLVLVFLLDLHHDG
jgi:hypothetical protein